ncbi:MAG: hypothetical protein M0R03_23800 [Novosphingobium sp.]|nr:hypothetical protein [Novosphingobium sp.]
MEEFDKIVFDEAINQMRKVMPQLKEYYELSAKALYLYFTQLQNAGFSSNEALSIVINHGIMPKLGGTNKEDLNE